MRGVGVNSEGRRTTSFANVTIFFCIPITTGGGGGGIGFEDARGGGIGVENGGGNGDGGGVENGGGNGDGGGGEDGGGRGHEDGMVRMTLPFKTCEDTRGTIMV
ncbi:unnamed protein product [Sphagnum balticum]